MEILLWLVPAALATIAAMAWISWVGSAAPKETEKRVRRHEARFADALNKPLPGESSARTVRDRSTGLVKRRSSDADAA